MAGRFFLSAAARMGRRPGFTTATTTTTPLCSTSSWFGMWSSPPTAPKIPPTATAVSTRGFASKKHKAVLRMAKGYKGRANRTFRAAIRRVEKALQYAYRDRKQRKRDFRKLWIERLNAGVRQYGVSYSRFVNDAKHSGVELDRKILSDLASNEPFSFKAVVDVVKMRSAASRAAQQQQQSSTGAS